MEDKKISEAVELLFKGAKMLAYHCPACNMPLFKHEGKIICPACKKEAEIIGEGKDAIVRLKEDDSKKVVEKKEPEKVIEPIKDEKLEDLLKGVIRVILSRLADAADIEDIETIRSYVDVLNSLLNVLERIKRLKI